MKSLRLILLLVVITVVFSVSHVTADSADATGAQHFVQPRLQEPEDEENLCDDKQLSVGQENIVLRARQVYEIEWTPVRNVIKWGRTGVFRADETVQGLPYGMPNEKNYVPLRTSFAEFLEAVEDSNSRLYRATSTRTNIAPYFSLDCSAFISWAWGLENRLMTGDLHRVSDVLGRKIEDIQVGDALNHPGFHVVLVTEIEYDRRGEVIEIGIMELDVPKAQFTLYGEGGDFTLQSFMRKYLNNGFVILRYKERDDVIYLHDCAVPLDGDYCDECIDDNTDSGIPLFLDRLSGARDIDAVGFICATGAAGTGIINTQTFSYDISRGMFISLLSKYAGARLRSYNESEFCDVSADEWYTQSIAWAEDIGIIDTKNCRFRPRQPISDEEMAKTMLRYFRWVNENSNSGSPILFLSSSN